MADRLELKKRIAQRLLEIVTKAQQRLGPEEQDISGIKNISRKLGEFITTPASSLAWDLEALDKLDGPKLFRAIAGAWDSGQRTNNGRLIIQKGGGKLRIQNPFTGETSLKDTRPGTRVHHKVQIASVYRSIEDLSLDRQIDLVEALADRAYMTGNDPANIISLLDYTHEYAGSNATHVWGDTVGRNFRIKLTPDMSFEEQLDGLIETAVKPQYKDVIRATGPGTVEFAVNAQRAKDFRNITGSNIESATPEEIKTFNQWLDERKSLPIDKRDAFDESLVDPENKRTYQIYRDHHENVVAGERSSGLGPLKGAARKELDQLLISARSNPPKTSEYLQALNNGEPVPSRGGVRTNLTNSVRISNALKMGYEPSMGMTILPARLGDVGGSLQNHASGLIGGAAVGMMTDPELHNAVAKGDVVGAGTKLAGDAVVGGLIQRYAPAAIANPVGAALLAATPAGSQDMSRQRARLSLIDRIPPPVATNYPTLPNTKANLSRVPIPVATNRPKLMPTNPIVNEAKYWWNRAVNAITRKET